MKQGSLLGVMRIQPRGSTPPKPRVARRKNSESRPPEWLESCAYFGIGCDSHTRFQIIAMLDREGGEGFERRLYHPGKEFEGAYEAQEGNS